MPLNVAYQGDLEFLAHITGDRNEQYCNAVWLKSPFEDAIWDCCFSKQHRIKISFSVRLDNGELLTDSRHRNLLETMKYWLCVQTHFDATGGRVLGPEAALYKVSRTLHIIDYLLLNAQSLQLAEHGLSLLTENDIRGLLLKLSTSNSIENSIYEWPIRLAEFLRKQIKSLTQPQVDSLIRQYPPLAGDLPPSYCRVLNLTDDELIWARAWLWSHSFYRQFYRVDFRYTPNNERLTALLYSETLRGGTSKKIPDELRLEPIKRYIREFESVPVRTNEEDKLSSKSLNCYCSAIRSLGLLSETKYSVPLNALRAIDSMSLRQALNLKNTGRIRTLPHHVVFYSIRRAIEFAIEFGDDLIQSYLSLTECSASQGQSCMAYANNHSIEKFISPKLINLGVKTWTIDMTQDNFISDRVRIPTKDYFSTLRTNPGLWELIRVLYGGIQVSVGALMARRNGELIDLVVGQCLDDQGTHLIFKNRKSGAIGIRETEARPIPKIAATMIRQLEGLQTGLVKIGVLHRYVNLFCFPNQKGNVLVSDPNQNRLSETIDYFCDYFETPRNEKGERYYIRQHQLRRFFAMLFFWGKSFGGMETLRWFLGHSDVEHLYHYITESTPGEVLRSIKSQYCGELIRNADPEAILLAEILASHFGTCDFAVLDAAELDEYIEELLNEGRVEIEPEFFATPDGKTFRIALKVMHKDHHNGG